MLDFEVLPGEKLPYQAEQGENNNEES